MIITNKSIPKPRIVKSTISYSRYSDIQKNIYPSIRIQTRDFNNPLPTTFISWL